MIRALLLFLLLLPLPLQAKAIIGDTSIRHIDIDSYFTGTNLMIFGAREEAGDVIVVVRGPERNFVIRRKKRRLGVWVNVEQHAMLNIPEFYAVASSRRLEDIPAQPLLDSLEIGQLHLPYSLQAQEFIEAFRRLRAKQMLYPEDIEISFMGETLFKTVIRFPEKIPRGTYTAEFYLINDGQLVGMQSIPIQVSKVGMDAAIYDLAHSYPYAYGILSIGLALAAGWFAAWVFRKQ
ncbi:MAG: TIGR02186 family protein [Alphaproteobacteria bacterium]|nr:TIGR02186 family protein [Alphaproteobacteria bacterium]